MQNEQLQRIWKEWQNVIMVTVAVVVTMTAMFWMPPIMPYFGVEPGKVETTTNQVMNMMWWVVFFLAAQSIFGNRKKRLAAKKAAEATANASDVIEAPVDEESTPRL